MPLSAPEHEHSATILGAGHVGCAMAADFIKRRGDKVMLYAHRDHPGNIPWTQTKGRLLSTGEVQCEIEVGKPDSKLFITGSMTEAVNFSQFLFLTVPAYGYDDMLEEMVENDLSEHLLTLVPGNLSALVVLLAFMRVQPKYRPRFVIEVSSAPQACRAKEADVHIFGVKRMVHIASLPVDITPSLRDKMNGFVPKQTEWVGNVLEVDFLCVNPVIHAVAMVLYADLIEQTKGDFYFYRDMPEHIIEAILEADDDRRALAIKYAGRADTLIEISNDLYDEDYPDVKTFFWNSRAHAQIKGPPSLDDRMFKEEVQILAGWIEFGALDGIESPKLRWIVDKSRELLKKDYAQTGRTLGKLNISGLSSGKILDIFNCGQEKFDNALKSAFSIIEAM